MVLVLFDPGLLICCSAKSVGDSEVSSRLKRTYLRFMLFWDLVLGGFNGGSCHCWICCHSLIFFSLHFFSLWRYLFVRSVIRSYKYTPHEQLKYQRQPARLIVRPQPNSMFMLPAASLLPSKAAPLGVSNSKVRNCTSFIVG